MNDEAILGVAVPAPEHLLILAAIPPSLNKYLRLHWAAKGRLRANFGLHIRKAIGRDEVAHQDRLGHVQIIIYSNAPKGTGGRSKRLDRDNLWGGAKPLVDALRDQEVVKNDTDKWLDLGIAECRDKVETPRTEIAITYNAKQAGKNLPPLLSEKRKRGLLSAKGVDDGNQKVGVFSSPQKKTKRIIGTDYRNDNSPGKMQSIPRD